MLDAFGADTITPAQQQADKTVEDELMDEESWQNDRVSYVATVDYLIQRGYPLPEPILRRAEKWRAS